MLSARGHCHFAVGLASLGSARPACRRSGPRSRHGSRPAPREGQLQNLWRSGETPVRRAGGSRPRRRPRPSRSRPRPSRSRPRPSRSRPRPSRSRPRPRAAARGRGGRRPRPSRTGEFGYQLSPSPAPPELPVFRADLDQLECLGFPAAFYGYCVCRHHRVGIHPSQRVQRPGSVHRQRRGESDSGTDGDPRRQS